jgi:hypothetical protein
MEEAKSEGIPDISSSGTEESKERISWRIYKKVLNSEDSALGALTPGRQKGRRKKILTKRYSEAAFAYTQV